MNWKANIDWLKMVFADPMYQEILGRGKALADDNLQLLLDISEEKFFEKGDVLQRADYIGNYLYIIKSGAIRAFYLKEGVDVTSWFAFENHFVFTTSFMTGVPAFETLETIEDCEVLAIHMPSLYKEYDNNIELANWGRRFAELGMVYVENQLYDMRFRSAQERYNRLIATQPEIIQRCKLGHVASYLGVTQVTLSRIRAAYKK